MVNISKIVSGVGKNLISGFVDKTTNIIDSVGDIVSKKEELKIEAERLMYTMEAKYIEAMTEAVRIESDNLKAAYERESKINESTSASWLTKNTQSILSLTTFYITAALLYIIIFCDYPKEKEDVIKSSLFIMSGLTSMVFGYYYTSSVGSRFKDETVMKLNEKLRLANLKNQ